MGWFNIALTCVMLASIILSTICSWNRKRLRNNNLKFYMTISLKTFYSALFLEVIVGAFLHFLVITSGIFKHYIYIM